MCMCIYVYIYMYICVYICIHIYIYIYIYIYKDARPAPNERTPKAPRGDRRPASFEKGLLSRDSSLLQIPKRSRSPVTRICRALNAIMNTTVDAKCKIRTRILDSTPSFRLQSRSAYVTLKAGKVWFDPRIR